MKNILLFLSLFISNCHYCQNVDWRWVTGVTNYIEYPHVSCDQSGNVFISGHYNDSALVAGQLLKGNKKNMFLAKYSPQGKPYWAKTLIKTGGFFRHILVQDHLGNIYLTGWYSTKTIQLGDSVFYDSLGHGTTSFISKFDKDGNLIWADCILNTSQNSILGIDVDDNQNIVLSGYFDSDTMKWQGVKFQPSFGNFIIKLDSNGKMTWYFQDDDLIGYYIRRTQFDKQGNIHILARKFSSPELVRIRQYSPSGKLHWTTYHSVPKLFNEEMVIDGQGNTFLVLNDMLYQLDSNGTKKWQKSLYGNIKGAAFFNLTDLYLNAKDNIFATGHYYGKEFTIDGITYKNIYEGDTNDIRALFVMNLNASGDVNWMKGTISRCDNFSFGIHATSDNIVYITGEAHCTPIVFGKETLQSGSNSRYFLARLDDGNYTDIQTLSHNPTTIYPCPASNIVKIESETPLTEFELYDLTGQKLSIKNFKREGSVYSIDVSHLARGMYNIILRNENISHSQKIVLH